MLWTSNMSDTFAHVSGVDGEFTLNADDLLIVVDEVERLRASKPTIEYHCSGGHFIVASVTTLEGQTCTAPGCQGIVGAPETDLTKRIRMQREEIRTLHELRKRAADEVERLRAALDEITHYWSRGPIDPGWKEIARRALEES